MTEPAREQLLGYLLNALDDDTQADIEKLLDNDAGLRRDLATLNRALAPLDVTRCEFSPPNGLAARTCEFVAAHDGDAAWPVYLELAQKPRTGCKAHCGVD